MQLSNSPGKLVLPFANSGNKNSIPVASQIGITPGAASLADGFPPLTMTPVAAGGVPPSGLDMNGILFELSAVVRWANAGGGYPFDADFATDINVNGYPKGARVMRSDGLGYWFNTVENNTTDPEAAGAAAAGWVPDFTNGVTAVTMTSANVTLTPLQYGKPIIVITGTLTANLNLIFPAIVNEWTVINNTTGAFTITCKTATGAGVVVNTSALIVGDGTDIQSAVPDASLVGYSPYGTGAIATSVQTKLRESISVKDFGAVGDGVTDDTTAIQAAIDAVYGLGGGRLLFPAGTYKVSAAPLTLRDKVQLIGAGSQCTTLDFSAQAAFASNSGFINLMGGGLGALQSVTASASEGATAITVSGSGIAAGDMIQIRSTEFYDGHPEPITAVAYSASTAYTKGQIVNVNGNWYVCQTAGTTGASSPPSGTSNPITDGTVTWYYAPMVDASYQTPWSAIEVITLGSLRVTYAGRIYVCVTAGTTSSTEPTSTATVSLVTDGSVSWRYVARYNCRKAEFASVQSVSGATVNLSQPLRMGYPQAGSSAYTVEAAKVSFTKAGISGFTINGKGLPNDIVQTGGYKYLFSGSSADIAVDAIWASIDCDDLTFTNIEQVGIKLQSCYDCSVRRFRIINNPKNLISQQYGIWVARGSSNIRISDYYGRNSRHIITTDGSTSLSQDYYRGVPCDIVMTIGSGDGIWQSAVDTHAGGLDVVANGGVFNTLDCGVKFRSKRTSVSNFLINSLTDNASGYSDGAFSLYFDGGDCTLSNIETRGGLYGVRISDTSGASIGGIVGANILVKDAREYGIRIGNNAWDAFGSINLSGITVQYTKNNYNLFLNGQFSEFVLNGLVSNGGTYGIRTGQLSSFKRFSLNGFSVSDFTDEGLYLENLTNFALSGGVVDKPNTTAAAIRIRNSKVGVLNGITVNMAASSASAQGVFLSSASSGMTDRVVVDGVQVNLPSGTATGVYIEADATNCTVGPACELRSCTTQIAWNAGTTGRGGYMTGSATYDPPSLASGAGATTTVAVSGAAVGDAVYCSFSNDLQGITLTGYVSAGSTVAVRFQNNTGGTIDLASGALKVTVVKMG